jgi:hypothetical protein
MNGTDRAEAKKGGAKIVRTGRVAWTGGCRSRYNVGTGEEYVLQLCWTASEDTSPGWSSIRRLPWSRLLEEGQIAFLSCYRTDGTLTSGEIGLVNTASPTFNQKPVDKKQAAKDNRP